LKPFLIAYAAFVLLLSTLVLIYPKEELFLLLNGSYSDLGDAVFPYITHLGSGVLSAIVVVVFLFRQYRLAIISSVSFLVTGLITQLLKHTLFSEALRPFKYFEGQDVVHSVADVQLYMYNSFPSGHSATAFSLFFMLLLASDGRRPILAIVLCMLAVLTGYSRIYLGLHFPEDVLAGSLIGVIFTFLCFRLLDKKLVRTTWANKGLFNRPQ